MQDKSVGLLTLGECCDLSTCKIKDVGIMSEVGRKKKKAFDIFSIMNRKVPLICNLSICFMHHVRYKQFSIRFLLEIRLSKIITKYTNEKTWYHRDSRLLGCHGLVCTVI